MSDLLTRLNLTEEELKKHTLNCNPRMRKALKAAVFKNVSYRNAGMEYGVSRQSIFYHLKRIEEERDDG